MKRKKEQIDTYESGNFPTYSRVVYKSYLDDYHVTIDQVRIIQRDIILASAVTFIVGSALVGIHASMHALFLVFLIAVTLISGMILVPELVIRHYIEKGWLTPPKRKSK